MTWRAILTAIRVWQLRRLARRHVRQLGDTRLEAMRALLKANE